MASGKTVDSYVANLASKSHFTAKKGGKEFTDKQKQRIEAQQIIHSYAAKKNANSIKGQKAILSQKWSSIINWFTAHETEINKARRNLDDFPALNLRSQKEIMDEARNLFSKFREDNGIGHDPSEPAPKNIKVWAEDQAALIQMVQYMNEGTKPDKQENTYPEMVKRELDLAASTGITQLTTMNPNKVKNAFHSYLFSSGKKNDESFKHLESIMKKLRDVKSSRGVESLFMNTDNAKGLADFLDDAKKAAEAQQDDFDSDEDGGIWKAQEANLDRVFHMCYIFWRLCQASDMITKYSNSLPTGIDLMVSVLNKQLHKIMGEDVILKTFSQHGVMKHLKTVLDGIGGGTDRESHKYQHPLMVTMKRFLVGLSTITSTPVISQLLNCLEPNDAASIHSILTYFKMDLETTERQIERSSTWLMHNYLKGYGSAFYYTGNVTGNVLSGKLTITNKPNRPKEDIMSTYAKIASFSSMTSSQMTQILENETNNQAAASSSDRV